MKSYKGAVEEYLALRRGLGFKLRDAGLALLDFAAFLDGKQAPHITSELALRWAMLPRQCQPALWAARLRYARGFARYRLAADPCTEIPPSTLLPFQPQRARPYLYSDQEIERLLVAASALPPLAGLRGATYHCLFGLLTVTGLRISEAIALEPRDVDLQHGVLTIRGAKFGKSRLVPLHLSSKRVLARYARRRDRHLGSSIPPRFLVNDRGRSLESSNVRRVFYKLSRQIGLRGPTDSHGPRLHDFKTSICGQNSNALVSIRPGCRTTPAGALDLLGTRPYRRHLLVPQRTSAADGPRQAAPGEALGVLAMKNTHDLPVLLERFFTQRLMAQRRASTHTIGSYRDTFRLLLIFAQRQLRKTPSALSLTDLQAPFVGAFLDDLESGRGNTARSRNLRLTAIRSFFRFAAYEDPAHAALIQRVLAIPNKRYEKKLVGFLTRPEITALLDVPDLSHWAGRRDRALLLLAVQTGLRVSELTALRREDLVLGSGAHVRCQGKGRKERCTPLTRQLSRVLAAWLNEPTHRATGLLFTSARGTRLSTDGVQYLLAKHLATARQRCPSLQQKAVSPHVLRHTAAMELLQAGVDRSVIALWLGHESVETTQIYLDANLAIKQEALAKTRPAHSRLGRFKADDHLLHFLATMTAPKTMPSIGYANPMNPAPLHRQLGIVRRSG